MKNFQKYKLFILVIITTLILGACTLPYPSADVEPELENVFLPPAFSAEFASIVCKNQPAKYFDPLTGKIECFDVEPVEKPEEVEIDSEEDEEVGVSTSVVCPEKVSLKLPAEVRVNKDEDTIYSYSYDITTAPPYTVDIPCGYTGTIASGTITIDGVNYPADEDQGNVNFSTCENEAGCSYVLNDYTVGHVGVTLSDSQEEESNLTVFNAVENMFRIDSGNCGSSACIGGVFVFDLDGEHKDAFFEVAPKSYLDVYAGFSSITFGETVVVGDLPDSAVNLWSNDEIVGYTYTLGEGSSKIHHLGVPENSTTETHGVVLYCAIDYVVDGVEFPAESVVLLSGNYSDNNSPNDLNWTAKVQSEDDSLCEVFFIHADEVSLYVGFPAGKVDVYTLTPEGLLD